MPTCDEEHVLEGMVAIFWDHIRRGYRYAEKEGYLRHGQGNLSVWVLQELGAALLLREWREAGRRGLSHTSSLDIARLNLIAVFLPQFLYCAQPQWNLPSLGPVSQSMLVYRFQHEAWGDWAEFLRGEALSQSEVAVQLDEVVLDQFARLLWAKRSVIQN